MSSERAEMEKDRRRRSLARVYGSMPWLRTKDVKDYRVKLFKSGNSLAVRIPAGLKLSAGMEMNMRVEDGEHLTLDPIEPIKRKFDVDAIWGIAPGAELIKPEDRAFVERDLPAAAGPADDDRRR